MESLETDGWKVWRQMDGKFGDRWMESLETDGWNVWRPRRRESLETDGGKVWRQTDGKFWRQMDGKFLNRSMATSFKTREGQKVLRQKGGKF